MLSVQIFFNSYQDAAIEVPYYVIKSSMAIWRRAVWPANRSSLANFYNQLSAARNEHLSSYNYTSMSTDSVIDGDGEQHLVFHDPAFIREVMPNVTKVFIDATFQTTPAMVGVYQLLTLMVVTHGHVSLRFHYNSCKHELFSLIMQV